MTPATSARAQGRRVPGSEASAGRAAAGATAALGLVAVAVVAGFAPGFSSLVTYAYLAAAPLLAWRLLRRDAGAFVVFVLWLWLLTPEVRRITNFTAGWNPDDAIMAAPGLATLVGARALVSCRLPRAAAPLVVMLAAVGYGTVIGVFQAGPPAAVAGLAYWLPPILLGLLVMSDAVPADELHGALRHIAGWGTLAVGVYGLVQFFVLPEWDRQWMINTELTTIGLPEPQEVRVFSTLNAPYPLGSVLAGLLIAINGVRSRVALAAAAAGVVTLGLSLARSGWLGWAVGLAVLMLVSRRGRRQGLVLALAPLVLLAMFGGPVEHTIRDRFDQSADAGSSDDSLTARIRFHQEMVPTALSDPVGNGMGTTGVASEQAEAGAEALGTFDGAIPESLYALGGLAGAAYLWAAARLTWTAIAGVRKRGPAATVAAAATAAIAAQALFGHSLIAGSGVLFVVGAAAAVKAPGSHGKPPPVAAAGGRP